jgi:diguanylate cyclase (GGDEF)-like protein/PAS domain S-box-containing protein
MMQGFNLFQMVESSPVATIVLDGEHRVTHWNRACTQLTGIPAERVLGTREQWRVAYRKARPILADLLIDGVLAGDADLGEPGNIRKSVTVEGAFESEEFLPHLGNGGRWLFFTATAIHDAQGLVVGAIETVQDITERRLAENALAEKEAFLAQIVDGSSVATLVIDSDHRITHWNHACEVLTGTLAKDVLGTTQQWRAFYPAERPIMADLILSGAQEGAIDRLYHGRFRPSQVVQGGFEAEDFFAHMGSSGRWLFFTAAPLRNAMGEVVGAIETLQDVTERRRAEEALRESEERYRTLSVTDSLTGLYNSRHMHERLQAEMERAQRYSRPLSLLDTYGHLVGDQVLQALAVVVTSTLRRTDSGFRYGGEEFVAILPEANEAAAVILADRIRQRFAEQVVVTDAGEEIRCTISVGVSQFSIGDTRSSLIKRADEATYEAKRRGKNCVVAAEE